MKLWAYQFEAFNFEITCQIVCNYKRPMSTIIIFQYTIFVQYLKRDYEWLRQLNFDIVTLCANVWMYFFVVWKFSIYVSYLRFVLPFFTLCVGLTVSLTHMRTFFKQRACKFFTTNHCWLFDSKNKSTFLTFALLTLFTLEICLCRWWSWTKNGLQIK